MRQGSNVKRSRNRGARRGHNPRSHTLDSNGPSVRIRGNALQIYEKYQQLARDASSTGDRVSAENYFQHAEHYYRMASSAGIADMPFGIGGLRDGDEVGAEKDTGHAGHAE